MCNACGKNYSDGGDCFCEDMLEQEYQAHKTFEPVDDVILPEPVIPQAMFVVDDYIPF